MLILRVFLFMKFLLDLHPALSVTLLCIFTVGLAYIGLKIVRKKFTQDILQENHEVGGFIFNAFGLIYAVLVAFVVFVTWNEYDNARGNVDLEASELADLYNTSKAFPDSTKKLVDAALIEYIENVTGDEWKLLEEGELSVKARKSIEKLWIIYSSIDVNKLPNIPVYQESLKHLNDLGEKRRTRIFDSRDNIPGIMWAALLFGGVMCVIFTYFFSTRRFMPQLIMTSALTVLNTLILYMIFVLDHPFRGSMKITPEAFDYVLNLVKNSL
jgi:hypothetical protein